MKNERLIKNIIVLILIFITLWFGIRPVITGTFFKRNLNISRQDLSFESNEYATIIIGSDPEGIVSALTCARTGLKTLLITKDSGLGGYIKKSMISKMDPQKGTIDESKVSFNKGIYEEIFGQFSIGFSSLEYQTQVKRLADSEDNLSIIYDSYVSEVDIIDRVLLGITVMQPDGKHYYKARNFIDATYGGDLLKLCNTPYTKGSEDIGVSDFYAPVEFNFCVSAVDTKALKKSQKVTNFIDEFQLALLSYDQINPNTKIVSPSFIILNDNEIVITGLQVYGVDVEDENALKSAYKEAEEEAIMLLAYLKSVMVAFENCTYKTGPENFFIPEYLHFKGRYTLTVADIMENRNFKNKIALCSQPVDAGKFIDKNIEYIVAKPCVYSIPLGSIIPENMENVLMTGAKASFTSLASTSAGNLPTRITVGESVGLICAYSFLNNVAPSQMIEMSDNEQRELTKYLKRGGVYLQDFEEAIFIPNTEQKLKDHQAYPYIKILAEYGLIAGGMDNDYKLDSKVSQQLISVLIKNAIIKMKPDMYTLKIDGALKPYEIKDILTGEDAGEIILTTLSLPYSAGEALNTLKNEKILPESLTDSLKEKEPVSMDVVYGLSVETVRAMK